MAPPARDISIADYDALSHARHGDPFSILGMHCGPDGRVVRAYLPGAREAFLLSGRNRRRMLQCAAGYFEIDVARRMHYRLEVDWGETVESFVDPYCFGPIVSPEDVWLFAEGKLRDFAACLGATPRCIDHVEGVAFVVWAPNAANVSVVGDFNAWDARRHPMRLRPEAGLWELFVPGAKIGQSYKYAIRARDGEMLPFKADPVARQAELAPRTASRVAPPLRYEWTDADWMASREGRQSVAAPMSIYEVHIGAWLDDWEHRAPSWAEAADRLIPYARDMGFTHLELLPITEYPFGGSWGYQPLSLFAPTARYGDPADFAAFVDRAHAAGLAVILDWVPGHFPNDEHGLARFDGTALYEHDDPREGFHRDWNTLIYNYGRREVRAFLIASALYWLEKFHIDGLRVDAVASMLYRDYSREPGEWVPNHLGGRENLEAVGFLRELNETIADRCPGAITIAEESTAWPFVTSASRDGGLGFTYKWNMGWMNDTLRFFARDPIHRSHHLDDISFGLHYGFSEAFVLPLSHDEVVHGKGSLLAKMPGDEWRKFANLRLLYGMMWTHPGKKLLFMGGEVGAADEFNVDCAFPWPAEDDRYRRGLMRLVQDLNRILRERPALHAKDRTPDGFAWIIMHAPDISVFAFRRSSGDPQRDLICIVNMTPVPRPDFEIGAPHAGAYIELLNTDAVEYGGSGVGAGGRVATQAHPRHGQAQSLTLTLPPLGALVLAPDTDQ